MAVVGDGKLGLLVAQALAVQGLSSIVHFGKHEAKLRLVQGTRWETVDSGTAQKHAQARAVGHTSKGFRLRLHAARSMRCMRGWTALASTSGHSDLM